MAVWLDRFFSGFKIWSPEKIGKIIYISVICIAVIVVYGMVSGKRTTQVQTIQAQTAVVQAPAPENKKKAFLGIRLFGLGAGLFWE